MEFTSSSETRSLRLTTSSRTCRDDRALGAADRLGEEQQRDRVMDGGEVVADGLPVGFREQRHSLRT